MRVEGEVWNQSVPAVHNSVEDRLEVEHDAKHDWDLADILTSGDNGGTSSSHDTISMIRENCCLDAKKRSGTRRRTFS